MLETLSKHTWTIIFGIFTLVSFKIMATDGVNIGTVLYSLLVIIMTFISFFTADNDDYDGYNY